MIESPLLKLSHPLAVHRRPPLASNENALTAWLAAGNALANIDEISALSYLDDECGCNEVDCLVCHPLEPAKLHERIRSVLNNNADALRHLDVALSIGSLQVPLAPCFIEDKTPSENLTISDVARQLVRLKRIQAIWLAEQGDTDSAAEKICEIFKLGRMYCRGEGMVVDALIAGAVQGVAVSAALELVRTTRLASDRINKIRIELEQVWRPEAIASALAVENSGWALPLLDLLEPSLPHSELMSRYFVYFDNHEPRHEQCRFVLEGHPQLWDQTETARVVSLQFARVIADLLNDSGISASIQSELSPWNELFERFHRSWPAEFSAWVLSEEWFPDYEQPVTTVSAERLVEIRDELRQFSNPLGLLVATQLKPMDATVFSCPEAMASTIAELKSLIG